jgi:hypothetical protein
MACYGMRLSPAAAFGLERDDTSWLEEHPEVAIMFERFCTGPTTPDLLLPPEQRPQAAMGLDEAEELKLWEYMFKE